MSPKQNDFVTQFDAQDAADAISEHGFLLTQVVREKIRSGVQGDIDNGWKILGAEYPVTAMDGSQTKIDLVLAHVRAANVHICLECKRPNPKFKFWLFFDKQNADFFIEQGRMASHTGGQPIDYKQSIASGFSAKNLSAFNGYLEATVKRNSDKVSNTETIEKGLRQIIAGHTGLMEKLRRFEREAMSFYRSIPVLVTTAQLFEAKFNAKDIALKTGMIEPSSIEMSALNFCAVNYHSDDSLSIPRQYTSHRKGDVATDIMFFQNRTVFIVNSLAINDFLSWAGHYLTEHPT